MNEQRRSLRAQWGTYHIGQGALLLGLVVFALIGCRQAQSVPTAVAFPSGAEQPSNAPTAVTHSQPSAQTPSPVPAKALAAEVSGRPIYLADYEQQVNEWEEAFVSQNENLNAEEKQAMLEQGRRQVLDVMIEQSLIEQAAAREGVALTDAEVEKVIQRDIAENGGQSQFEAWLQANHWTYEEYRSRQRAMMLASAMFERVTQNVPTTAEQVHARHILVATEAEARSLLDQLQKGADFAELARQNSLDPSTKESGGDLGFFPRATLVVPEVEEAAFSLGVGQISDVVQSAMGFHIVQVLEREQERELSEESWQGLRMATFRRWVSELWDAAEVKVHVSL
jgi:peptidyl-prolyl cis-trans isomerase C